MFKDNKPGNLLLEKQALVQRFTIGRIRQKLVPPLVKIMFCITLESRPKVVEKGNKFSNSSYSVSYPQKSAFY